MKKVIMSISINDILEAKLKNIREKTGLNMSDIIRRACMEYINVHTDKETGEINI